MNKKGGSVISTFIYVMKATGNERISVFWYYI